MNISNHEIKVKIEPGQAEEAFREIIPAGEYDMEAQLIDKEDGVHPAYSVYIEEL